MKIIIFGATGDVGRQAVAEALTRGHEVTAVARNPGTLAPSEGLRPVALDLLKHPDEVASHMVGHDAAISALRPPQGQEPNLVPLTKAVLAGANDLPVYITGGAACLKLDTNSPHTVLTAPGFLPDSVRPIAEACAEQDKLLSTFPKTKWTCLRPPALLLNGPRTGRYALGRDTLVKNSEDEASISYADFAVALLDLVELRPEPHQRLTVGW